MRDGKSYGQFCALARAMDRVGDRWTMLIVRELLLGPARYGELSAALPGMASNLLAQRLKQLTADGIVSRTEADGRPVYRLTPRGEALEPVLLALIRWGAAYMPEGPGEDVVDERWALLAMRAMLATASGNLPHGEVAVRCGELEFGVVVDAEGRRVVAGPAQRPTATVTAPVLALLPAVGFGVWSDDVTVEGDADFARAALTSSPEPASIR